MGNLFDKIKKQTERHAHAMGIKPQQVKEMTMRDMLAKTRRTKTIITEAEIEVTNEPAVTNTEKTRQEDEMRNYFADDQVTIEFHPEFIHQDGYTFMAGEVDGQLQFTYAVAPDEEKSKVDFTFGPGFDQTNEDNKAIIKKLTDYYDVFYKYWRDNSNEQ